MMASHDKLLSPCDAARLVADELLQLADASRNDPHRPEREKRLRIESLPGRATFFGKAIVLLAHPLAARVFAQRQADSDAYFETVRASEPGLVRPDSVNRVQQTPEAIVFIPQRVKDLTNPGFKPWLLTLRCEQIYENPNVLAEALRERRTPKVVGKDRIPAPGVLVRGEARPTDVARLCGRHDGNLLNPVEGRNDLLLYLCGWDWSAGAFLYQNVFVPGLHRENVLPSERLVDGIETFIKEVEGLKR